MFDSHKLPPIHSQTKLRRSMREFSQSTRTWRDPKSMPCPVAATADDGLAAIMARRRALADSSVASGNNHKNNLIRNKPASPVVVDPELQAAMERRQTAGSLVSPRQNRTLLSPPSSSQLFMLQTLQPLQSTSVDDSRKGYNSAENDGSQRQGHNAVSFSATGQPLSGSEKSAEAEYEYEQEQDEGTSSFASNEEETTASDQDEVEEEEEEEDQSHGHQPDEHDEFYATDDDDEEIFLLDDQTAQSMDQRKQIRDEQNENSSAGAPDDEEDDDDENSRDDSEEDEHEEFNEEEEEEEEFEDNGSELSNERQETNSYETNGENQHAEESTVITSETVGRNDSFFQDPGEYGANNSSEENDYLAEDEEEDEYDEAGLFRHPSFMGARSTMTGLTTLTEEGTLDLLSVSDIGGDRTVGENETIYEEVTVNGQSGVYDDKTISDGPTIYEDPSVDQSHFGAEESYYTDGRSQDGHSQDYYSDDGTEESSGSSDEDDGSVSVSDEDEDDSITADYVGEHNDRDEDDPMMEIETLNSSVVSSDLVSETDTWSQHDTPGYLLDRHFQANKTGEYDYMFEDGEKSILGELSVLDVVQEEASFDASGDVSADDSQIHSHPSSTQSRSQQEHATSNQSHIMSSKIEEDSDEDNVDGEDGDNSHGSCSTEDLEEARPYEKCNEKHKSKQAEKHCYCSWPFLAIMVLLASLLVGLGAGLFLLGFPNEEKTAQPTTPNPTPSIVPHSNENNLPGPTLPEDTLHLYKLICPKLWQAKNCEESLLDITRPSGMAFDWISNNKLSNPTIDMPERRILQRFALATFFFATNGYRWTVSSQWLSEIHECDWYTTSFRGHGCDDSRDVFIALELDFNNVQGELPEEMSLLQDLEVISIQNPVGPAMEGSIPSSLAAFSRLTSLQLVGNMFSGGIPKELGAIGGSLQSLIIMGSGLNGGIPATIANLTSLTLLDLSDNHFAGEIDNEIFQSLTGLETLNLSGNKFSRLPDSLSALTNLTKLNVADNDFRWFPIPIFSMGASLEWLDIRKNNFREPIPPSIGRLVNLQYLNMASSSFTGSIPVELGNLVKLTETLDLSSNLLIGSIPTRLGRLTSLERLLLNSNRLSGSIPLELSFLKHMVHVRLDDNNLIGFVPSQLCDLYDDIKPSSYADCDKLVFAECFLFCCSKELGCRCQYESSDPLLCLSN